MSAPTKISGVRPCLEVAGAGPPGKNPDPGRSLIVSPVPLGPFFSLGDARKPKIQQARAGDKKIKNSYYET